MEEHNIIDIARSVIEHGIDGIIATNTTTSRDLIKTHTLSSEAGGLSGAPLQNKSTKTIQLLASELSGKIPIIGVGGIMSAKDAIEKVKAGASLIQIYSGFIYKGPILIKEIADSLLQNQAVQKLISKSL